MNHPRSPARVDIVIPTIGRPSLQELLDSLAIALAQATAAQAPALVGCYVVDDRRAAPQPLLTHVNGQLPFRLIRASGRGPATARNIGWHAGQAEWVVFLDDDVVVTPSWWTDLGIDLASAGPRTAAVQARIEVPLPTHRRPNDAERNTAGLVIAQWITADMAVRRQAMHQVGGFDERFPLAFREDSDLALRLQDHGWRLRRGVRRTVHPARRGGWAQSVRQQRGNGGDVLMRQLHGRGWRRRCSAPTGRRPQHLLATAAGLTALTAAVAQRRRAALMAASLWTACFAEFSWRRIAPGPKDPAEVARMLVTSVLIPPTATWHWTRAWVRRAPRPWPGGLPAAVLFDRDGTLIEDVPYNGDPDRVRVMPGASAAVERLRESGIPIAVVSNQSGLARGLIQGFDVDAVNRRVEELLGPFDGWFVCPHSEADGCACRKPAPGLVRTAARELGVAVDRCVVIGDIGADMEAAAAAGASAVLVPTAATRATEIAAAGWRATDLGQAVDLILGDPEGIRP
jgi:histidinol-phosphate phosphatase family protein